MFQESIEWKSLYRPGTADSWYGRSDGYGPERFHEVVIPIDLTQPCSFPAESTKYAFLGFASDEGVNRNQGRPGAVDGPQALRAALSGLSISTEGKRLFYDMGDILCVNGDLEKAQIALGQVVTFLLSQKVFPIVLGGGHETAWGHFQGIAAAFPKGDCGIVNFDAHFDLRPPLAGDKGTSGSSFMQIAASRLSQGLPFDYACFGIQRMGNTASLFKKAHELNVTTVMADEFYQKDQEYCTKILDNFIRQHQRIYLTLCLDVFAAAFAPGVSAPQPLGLTPRHIVPLLHRLALSNKVVGFDISELSPPLDHRKQTAKLAASLIGEFIHYSTK